MRTSDDDRGTRSALFACLLAAVTALVASHALAAATPQPTVARAGDPATPDAVPAGYVVTPNGYFHPSCVHRIGADERVHGDGTIESADGRVRREAPCAYPRFTASGQRIDPIGRSDPHVPADVSGPGVDNYVRGDTLFTGTFEEYDGYIESTTSVLPPAKAVATMSARFAVPASPTRHDDQTVYLFPGLEYVEDVKTILQPVLGWNAFGDNAWTLTSWNCCMDGATNYAGPIAIAAGDVVVGTMSGSACDASTHVCANWAVKATNNASGETVTLNSVAYGQPFDWVFGGALEVYNFSRCDQLPAGRSVRFSSIDVTTIAGADLIGLPWSNSLPSALTVCDYDITINAPGNHAGDVTLHY